MQWTDGGGGTYREDPYGGAGYGYGDGYAYGYQDTATSTLSRDPVQAVHYGPYNAPYGSLHDGGRPVPEPVRHEDEAPGPVFVDASGRRERRVRRAARLAVIPAGGYVALLISMFVGGPDIGAPSVPQADTPHSGGSGVSAPDTPPDSAQPTEAHRSTDQPAGSRPAERTTSGPTAPAAPSGTTAQQSETAAPTSAPTAEPARNGRAIGSSRKPVK